MKSNNPSLLLIEDSKMINTALSAQLQKSSMPNFDVHTALTLETAKSIIHEQHIDYIILDLELPDGTGEDFITYLQTNGLDEKIKTIILTGNVQKERRSKLFEMGIIDYLSKDNPINFLANEIIKSINHHISHHDVRILIVDDSSTYLKHLKNILQNRNYIVEVTQHSSEVYETLKNKAFNLLITDLEMPEMSGIELLRQIRGDDQLLDLPIIGISGTTNQDLVAQLLKSGANDFLQKPFSIENLLLKVEVSVSLHKKQRKLNELNEFLQEEVRQKVAQIHQTNQLLELENRHAQMGHMVSALTHQWKQPLHGISLAADYIKHMGTADEEIIETINMIQEQVHFLSETMDSFKHFFKPGKEQKEFSVLGAFESVLKILGETYDNMDITLNGDKSLFTRGYPNEFYQVIINLLNNAQDAFEEHQHEQPEININVTQEGDTILTSVCDNAGGIPETIITKLFDQYVSTKGNKGSGIGLDMTRTIIEKIHGTIRAENRENGACFTIILPLYKGAGFESE